MSDQEKELFHHYLRSATRYLEFGAGSSTIFAASIPTLQKIVSVESSAQFIEDHVLTDTTVLERYKNSELQFNIVTLGQTKEWGFPATSNFRHLWPNYALSVFNTHEDFDFILIDGRFRVACTLASLLSVEAECTLAIHDFWNRPEYHIVLQFVDVIARVETLAIVRKKSYFDVIDAQRLLEEYQYRPA